MRFKAANAIDRQLEVAFDFKFVSFCIDNKRLIFKVGRRFRAVARRQITWVRCGFGKSLHSVDGLVNLDQLL